jgi:hypothetical protein
MADEVLKEWERRDNESPEAYEAFQAYLNLGPTRSLARTGQVLGKSTTLMEDWSTPNKHGWVRRALLWDRHQARLMNEVVLLGTASMRQRLTNQAMNMQLRAAKKIHDMSDQEIAALTPAQSVAFFRAAATVEMAARKIPDSELDQAERDDAPTFNITFLQGRPEGMVSVRMRTGEVGYIPAERVAEFLVEYPDAVAIQ